MLSVFQKDSLSVFLDVQDFLNTNYDYQHEQCLNQYFTINIYVVREEWTQARMLCIARKQFAGHDFNTEPIT